MLLQIVTMLLLTIMTVIAQGPPGVPPRQNQQFQQPPAPNQQQQFQQQTPPPPNQQQYQQQQMNVQEGHGHGSHGAANKLKFQSEIHNAEHIMEHLQDQIKTKPKDQMTEEELEFHYFKMHDYDNNNKLDGVEIGKALTHFHDDHEENSAKDPERNSKDVASLQSDDVREEEPEPSSEKAQHDKEYTDETLELLIDNFLSTYDTDDDGYIEYFEFKKGRPKHGEHPH